MKVESFDDWYDVRDKLMQLQREFPQFRKDFDVLINLIEAYLKRISQLSMSLKRQHSPAVEMRIQEYFDQINMALKEFEKSYMMLLLTQKR